MITCSKLQKSVDLKNRLASIVFNFKYLIISVTQMNSLVIAVQDSHSKKFTPVRDGPGQVRGRQGDLGQFVWTGPGFLQVKFISTGSKNIVSTSFFFSFQVPALLK